MRTPTVPHVLADITHDAEELAVKTAHLLTHAADRTVDAVLAPLSVDVDLEGLTSDDIEDWD